MATASHSRAFLERRLARTRLAPVKSSAVSRLGYDDVSRMAAVQFNGADEVYGYPNLSDLEVAGLLRVMQQHGSIGKFVSKVIKPNHDSERVSRKLNADE